MVLLSAFSAPAAGGSLTGSSSWTDLPDLTAVFNGFKKPDISTRRACLVASDGFHYVGLDTTPHQAQLARWLGLGSGGSGAPALPHGFTDVATAQTLVQLLTPALTVVLDPLLYLQQRGAKLSSPPGNMLPKLIHMTLRSKRAVAPHQILSILSWGRQHPGYTLLLYDDSDIDSYMRTYYPQFLGTYNRLRTPVERSDAWRYHVLCGHGGIYTDTDTVSSVPVESWLERILNSDGVANASLASGTSPALVVGIENRFHSQEDAELATYVRKVQMIQWTVAAKRGHPVLCGMGDAITKFVDAEQAAGVSSGGGVTLEDKVGADASILLRTGPGIWGDEVQKYLEKVSKPIDELTNGGVAADVLVLPQAAFGCNFKYWHPKADGPFVYHMYNNSWKTDGAKVAAVRLMQVRQDRAAQLQKLFLHAFLALAATVTGITALYVAAQVLAPRWLGPPHGKRRRLRHASSPRND